MLPAAPWVRLRRMVPDTVTSRIVMHHQAPRPGRWWGGWYAFFAFGDDSPDFRRHAGLVRGGIVGWAEPVRGCLGAAQRVPGHRGAQRDDQPHGGAVRVGW